MTEEPMRGAAALHRPMPRWPRRYTIVAMCVSGLFLCYIDRVNISVAVLSMQRDLGWTEVTKGWVLSSFFFGYMLLQLPAGWIANRYGGKIVMSVAVVLWSILTFLTPIAAAVSLAALLATRVLLGAGEAASFPALYNLYGKWVPKSERGRSVALLSSAIPAGTLFALITTGWIIERWGWHEAFYIFGVAGVVWWMLWCRLVSDDPRTDKHITAAERTLLTDSIPPRSAHVPWKSIFTSPAVYALLFNQFCSNWGFYMLLAWLPSYFANHLGLSIAQAGVYSAAPWLTMFLVGVCAGAVSDWLANKGVKIVVIRKTAQSFALLGCAVFLILASQATDAPSALLLMCLALGFLALTTIGYVPNFFDIAPRHADVLVGITNVTGNLPGVIGVAVTGWLVYQTGSYTSAFILTAVLNVLGVLVWLIFAKTDPIPLPDDPPESKNGGGTVGTDIPELRANAA